MLRRWEKFQLLFSCGWSVVWEVMPSLIFLLLLMGQVFSTLIYMAESRDNIHSLPEAMWFSIITMSTVGYGEIVPLTNWGKVITLILVIMSALYMAVPIGIVGSAFHQVWEDRDRLLCIQKVKDRFRAIGISALDIPYLFGRFGGQGILTLNEFQGMMMQMHLGIPPERQLELFASFDSDGSGEIGPKEFVRAFYPRSYHEVYGTLESEKLANDATAAGHNAAEKEKAELERAKSVDSSNATGSSSVANSIVSKTSA